MDRYRPQSEDTSRAAERVLFDAYRHMPPWEKVRRIRELCRASQRFALAGIRAQHPHASDEELRVRLAATRLDRDLLQRIFGPIPAR